MSDMVSVARERLAQHARETQAQNDSLPAECDLAMLGRTGSGAPTVMRCEGAVEALKEVLGFYAQNAKEKLAARDEQLREGARILMRAEHASSDSASQLQVEQAAMVVTRHSSVAASTDTDVCTDAEDK
ncbi:MAG: hypothetical protein FWD18_09145 [Micrococcales bacterium]|nr:hypothetical protein [Micrococcales bacterium]